MADTILITGATGNVGSEVVRQLAAAQVPIRALVRNRAKAAAIERAGVEIVEGDLARADTLALALTGVTRALLISSSEPRQTELQNNFIDAAKRAGRPHIVKISSVAVTPDSPVSFFRWHAATEQYLTQSGLPFTILRPNYFMQNTLGFAPTIAKEGKFYGAVRNGKMAMIDVRDIAAVAARLLTQLGHEGTTYEITGPESLSLAEVAAKLSTALGKPVSYVEVPAGAVRASLLSAGMPDWAAEAIAVMHELLSRDAAAQVNDLAQKISGKKPITFDQFARDFRSVFESAATAR